MKKSEIIFWSEILLSFLSIIMDLSTKRVGWLTSELFNVILCDPNLALSQFVKLKLIN